MSTPRGSSPSDAGRSAPSRLADPQTRLPYLPDDQLGHLCGQAIAAEVPWPPDVSYSVVARVERDALAYPEQFVKPSRWIPWRERPRPLAEGRGRTLTVLLVLAALVLAVGGLLVLSTRSVTAPIEADQGALQVIDLRPVITGLDAPDFVTGAGDGSGRLYVVEQGGRILQADADGNVRGRPYLDISDRVLSGGEQGLLGLAFHPSFARNGRLFVDYTRTPDGATVVSEFQAADGRADPASERILLVVDQPFPNHNGGMLAFDTTGMLLIGMGDGGGGGDSLGNGQDRATLLAKLLRIDVDGEQPYAIPPDNGLAGDPNARQEIYALGLRNPWRFSVDQATGTIIIGDVGQGTWEEIDAIPLGQGGLDFGWNEVEGPECFLPGCDLAAFTPPVASYSHDLGCSVVGGYVYRGTLQPELDGVYVFGDYCSGTIWAIREDALIDGSARAQDVGKLDGPLVSFGHGDDGELYAVDHDGAVLRLEALPTGG